MSLKVGDIFPNAHVCSVKKEKNEATDTTSLLKGKKVILFAVPGAYTPVCSNQHVPSFLNNLQTILDKGVNEVMCLSLNDPFVMRAWAESMDALGKILFIADGTGELAKLTGLTFDGSAADLGTRYKRFSMLIDDQVIKKLYVEDSPGQCSIADAETILTDL